MFFFKSKKIITSQFTLYYIMKQNVHIIYFHKKLFHIKNLKSILVKYKNNFMKTNSLTALNNV